MFSSILSIFLGLLRRTRTIWNCRNIKTFSPATHVCNNTSILHLLSHHYFQSMTTHVISFDPCRFLKDLQGTRLFDGEKLVFLSPFYEQEPSGRKLSGGLLAASEGVAEGWQRRFPSNPALSPLRPASKAYEFLPH